MNGAARCRCRGTTSRLQRSLLPQIRECHCRMTAAIVDSTLPLCALALIFLSYFNIDFHFSSWCPAPHPGPPPLASFDLRTSQQQKFRSFDFVPGAQFPMQLEQTPAPRFPTSPLALPFSPLPLRRRISTSFVDSFPFHRAEAVEHFVRRPRDSSFAFHATR